MNKHNNFKDNVKVALHIGSHAKGDCGSDRTIIGGGEFIDCKNNFKKN